MTRAVVANVHQLFELLVTVFVGAKDSAFLIGENEPPPSSPSSIGLPAVLFENLAGEHVRLVRKSRIENDEEVGAGLKVMDIKIVPAFPLCGPRLNLNSVELARATPDNAVDASIYDGKIDFKAPL